MQANQLDRYVDRATGKIGGAKRGVEVHNYRENYVAATNSFDNWCSDVMPNNWQHDRRLLLKAEPQVGKTGQSIIIPVMCIPSRLVLQQRLLCRCLHCLPAAPEKGTELH